MRHRTSPQAKQIEAEYQARRAIAAQRARDAQQMREATELVEKELGGKVLQSGP